MSQGTFSSHLMAITIARRNTPSFFLQEKRTCLEHYPHSDMTETVNLPDRDIVRFESRRSDR